MLHKSTHVCHLVESDNIAAFDVDDTLVMWDIPIGREEEAIDFDAFGYTHRVLPHLAHIELLKEFKARGQMVIVWSQGGREWAMAVVRALGLEEYVDVVMCKPKWVIDDMPPNAWISRSYLNLDGTRQVGHKVPGMSDNEEK